MSVPSDEERLARLEAQFEQIVERLDRSEEGRAAPIAPGAEHLSIEHIPQGDVLDHAHPRRGDNPLAG